MGHYLDIWESKGKHYAKCSKNMWCRVRISLPTLVHPEHTHAQVIVSDPEGISYTVICPIEGEIIL